MLAHAKQQIEIPLDDEDALITAAALSDLDNLPLTDHELAQFSQRTGRTRERSGTVFATVPLATGVIADGHSHRSV